MFYGGNYTVYPGISSESVNQLQMILDSINSMKDDIGNTIIGEMLAPTLFMLRLSNSVAETVGHTRYMSCVQDQWNQLVGYGNQTTCDQYMDAICFSEERLHELGVTNWSVFEPFLFQKEDLVAHEYNSVNNLFCSKPLYKTQDSIIVLYPNLIAEALVYYLLSSLEKHGLYKGMVLNSIMRQTSIMSKEFCDRGYEHIMSLDEVRGNDDIYTARVYRIDIDKYLAHVIPSTYSKYGADELFQNMNNTLDRAYRDIEGSLKRINIEFDQECMVVLISGMYYGHQTYSCGKDTIVINLADLFLVLRSERLNPLTFWKYKKALKILPPINPGLPFFSLWHMYNVNHQSFYFFDGEIPSELAIDYSMGIDSKCALYLSNDVHLALDTENRLKKVIKHTTLYQNCIYRELKMGSSLHFLLISNYMVPIWITLGGSKEHLHIKLIVGEAIAYWLWKMNPLLKPYISPEGLDVINISISASAQKDNVSDKQNTPAGSIEGIPIQKTGQGIDVELNSECDTLFMRSDNKAEYALMKEVLVNLLSISGSDIDIAELICAQCMKNDKAKMIHVTDRQDIFIPADSNWTHQLHNTDIDLLLDDTAKIVSSPVEKETDCNETREKLFAIDQVIYHYLSILEMRLQGCDINRLIETLMKSHEALILEKRKETWLSSSRRNCFPEVFSEHQKDIINIDNSMRAIRFLIEYSMHTPTAEYQLSNDAIEELMAVCYLINSFGFKKDVIYSKLWEIQIEKLSSGRLGIVEESDSYGEFIMATQERFYKQYERSYIDDYTRDYTDEALEEEYDSEFDSALIAEYGIDSSDFRNILLRLSKISRLGSSSVLSIKRDLLKDELQKSGISGDKVDAFLNMFVLEQRDSWKSLPEGFTRKDIEPWQFKRRLSMSFKPIIAQQDILIIGIHTLLQSYLYLSTGIHNGRLKEDFFKSTEMKKYSDKIIDLLSRDFVDMVKNQLNKLRPEMIVKKEVLINKHGDIDIPQDLGLGDIDILAYDANPKCAYSIECKRINFGRTPTEIRNERKRFIEDSRNQSSWISKHRRRHEWMSGNKEKIRAYLQLEDTDFSIKSYVVVSENIALQYMVQTDIPVVTLEELLNLFRE